MTLKVEFVSGHLFVGGVWGTLSSDHYLRCKMENCPFSLLMDVQVVEGKEVAMSCKKEVVPVHCHDFRDKSKRKRKKHSRPAEIHPRSPG